jgi:hypothetical protein
MRKFKWTFMKAFDYLVMKRPTLVISQHIAMICEGYQTHLQMKFGRLSDDWELLSNKTCTDEMLAHNTHKNGMIGHQPIQMDPSLLNKSIEKKRRINWKDA